MCVAHPRSEALSVPRLQRMSPREMKALGEVRHLWVFSPLLQLCRWAVTSLFVGAWSGHANVRSLRAVPRQGVQRAQHEIRTMCFFKCFLLVDSQCMQ